MCPPLGHSGARIGPVLLMRRAQRPSCGEVRPTDGSRGQGRLQMGRENMAWCEYQSVGASRESCGVHNRLQDEVPDDVVCETMARVQTRPALFKLLGCTLSPTKLVQLHQDPVGPKHFRVPDAAANFRPCCRSTVRSAAFYFALSIHHQRWD